MEAGPQPVVVGLDEAGRGSVLGPLAIAGIALDRQVIEELVELGVDDSKALSPARREQLAAEIRARTSAFVVHLSTPAEIDACRDDGGLDVHEAKVMAGIIRRLGVKDVIADAPGPGGRAFHRRLTWFVADPTFSLTAENGADARYGVVAAASILAKTARDAAIRELAANHGPIGSGYPSDPETVGFLETWARRGAGPPPFARRTWETVRRIYGPRQAEMF